MGHLFRRCSAISDIFAHRYHEKKRLVSGLLFSLFRQVDSGVMGYITLITTLISANLGTWVCIHAYGSVLISSVSREEGRRTYLSLEEKRMSG